MLREGMGSSVQRVLAIVLIVALAVAGGYYAFRSLVPPPADQAAGPLYATADVVRGDITVAVDASGPLSPSSGGGIQAPFPRGPVRGGMPSFIVDKVLVQEGDAVRMGQPLLQLVAPELASQVQTLAAEIEADRQDLADLLGIPPEAVDAANPAQGVTLRAPISGRISGLRAREGEEIQQGQIVARIVDDSEWRMTVRLSPLEFQGLKPDDVALVRFTQFDSVIEARITDMNPNPIPTPASALGACPSGPVLRPPQGSEGTGSGGGEGSPQAGPTFYQFAHLVTIQGPNPGLILPGMTAYVGFLPREAQDVQDPLQRAARARWAGNCATVEGYAREERVISRTNGIPTQVFVQEMQKVKAGDPIVALSGDETQDAIEKRLRELQQKETELEAMQSQLDQLTITAPMDGVVSELRAQAGQRIEPGEWLGSIFHTSNMDLWVEVDDADVLKVRPDAPVKVTVDALPGQTFEGRVTQIAMAGQNQSGITVFRVRIQVRGGPDLRPGMQAHAHIEAGSARGVLLVPLEAVFEEDGQTKVEVLQPDGTTKVVPVELGLMNDRVAEVRRGLEEGQKVVTGSSADVLPSQRIQSRDLLLPGQQEREGGGTSGRDGERGGDRPAPPGSRR
ncbi:efflux RND transporter periplasmic adaptor subunit [Caldinitratiruptor microaerophilus]|uniref:RND family efflux transporter, MFP subunit n=1 Tax=Caldinitratiruptor microaerophilus TaxID=671077 RepID=A0AA35CIG5_9FIRM|nr:efflux RND transporter periplasmic adaptor subunit [Caldinitratiruptor microaerophilus]BDG59587.1 hypothetical protein caldi_06770 [Caldinitratiruptor microaerophilus]